MASILPTDRAAFPAASPLRNAGARASAEEREPARGPVGGPRSPTGEPLTDAELRQLEELQRRDREVRAHEAAHKAAAGGLASGAPQFETVRGPDGRSYAVGGEVQISRRAGGGAEERLRDAEQLQRAALAPADPSTTDRQVAAQAAADAASARREVARERSEDSRERDSGAGASAAEGPDREPDPRRVEPGSIVDVSI